MPDTILVAETGRTTGSRASNRLRAAGKVPGTVYGHGMAPVAVAVERRELRHALTGPAGLNAVITLDFDGTKQPTVVKTMQRDPIKRVVTHVDFQVVNLDEEITVEVSITIEGEAKAVVAEAGVVDQQLASLPITTTPRNIPTGFTIDVSDLQLGDIIRVADIALPAGVSTPLDPDTLVVVASATRATTAAADLAEAEAAAAAEGDADTNS
jgi:large subunit ribosomal protein L25